MYCPGREKLMDPIKKLGNDKLSWRIFSYLDLETKSRLRRVSKDWMAAIDGGLEDDGRPVWLYVIFRKNRLSGHEKLSVNISFDGPIFWEKRVVYAYCCACHFIKNHEKALMGLCKRVAHRVQRLCVVDSPINFPFLSDSFFTFVNENFTNLQFIYLRELDLENINYPTVKKLAEHPTLKKFIVHQCRKIEVLQGFKALPQLLVVKGEIQGLKAFLLEMNAFPEDLESELPQEERSEASGESYVV